ncbi:PTS sugar transporter subunit IIA [Radiobacillus kanasensis]|uniref:PTS sugar transporter subunit IIA n=1 Tax=Radiobacillus kanasensis TaxID=2844358 RepID=UPI001E58595E|nr:PTS sugar transporter subunit IIA [Radiobacillus kanasensis]UFT98599.1 PTS sugar transporter subunit IIA [Radiobacillus kanasensis]
MECQLVTQKLKPDSKEEILHELASSLEHIKVVKPSFYQAILERERVFPTGLPSEPFGIAIPHTDTEHVYTPAIAVGFLEEPIDFTVMGTEDIQIPVHIVFMLAMKEPNDQLSLLENMINLIQDSVFLEQLSEMNQSRKDTELKELLNKQLLTV